MQAADHCIDSDALLDSLQYGHIALLVPLVTTNLLQHTGTTLDRHRCACLLPWHQQQIARAAAAGLRGLSVDLAPPWRQAGVSTVPNLQELLRYACVPKVSVLLLSLMLCAGCQTVTCCWACQLCWIPTMKTSGRGRG